MKIQQRKTEKSGAIHENIEGGREDNMTIIQ
jgi:hypothetical protein